MDRKLVWDWHNEHKVSNDYGSYDAQDHKDLRSLLNVLVSPACDLVQNFSMSITKQELDEGIDPSSKAYMQEHVDYRLLTGDPEHQDAALTTFGILAAMFRNNSKGNHSFFQRYYPRMPASPLTMPDPTGYDGSGLSEFAQLYNYNQSAPGTLGFSYLYNVSGACRPHVNAADKAMPLFLHRN